jgi:hypothetical protein
MSASEPIFMTQRRRIVEAYKQANESFSASTKPYKSTVTFSYQFANPIPPGPIASTSFIVWFVAPAGQVADWFSYKIGDRVPGNSFGAFATPYRPATENDTNISKARTTNGAEDFVIEGMSVSHRSTRADFSAVSEDQLFVPEITDPVVLQAIGGNVPIVDRASLYLPQPCQSQFNLEDTLFRALVGHISVEFEWDRSKTVKIGTLEQIPEGGANSYSQASGEPSTNNRYRIPEGYLWRRQGQPDSEFVTRGRLTEPICIPMPMVATPSSETAIFQYPTSLHIDVVMRLHGLSVKLPTRN